MERIQLRLNTGELQCVWVLGAGRAMLASIPITRTGHPTPSHGLTQPWGSIPSPNGQPRAAAGPVVLTAAVSPFVRGFCGERSTAAAVVGPPSRVLRGARPCLQVGCVARLWDMCLFTSRPSQRKPQESGARGGREVWLAPVSCRTLASPCCCER